MKISFEGKVALVTGAASGLGFATAKDFAESGASVALAVRNENAVGAAADRLTSNGHKAIAIRGGRARTDGPILKLIGSGP